MAPYTSSNSAYLIAFEDDATDVETSPPPSDRPVQAASLSQPLASSASSPRPRACLRTPDWTDDPLPPHSPQQLARTVSLCELGARRHPESYRNNNPPSPGGTEFYGAAIPRRLPFNGYSFDPEVHTPCTVEVASRPRPREVAHPHGVSTMPGWLGPEAPHVHASSAWSRDVEGPLLRGILHTAFREPVKVDWDAPSPSQTSLPSQFHSSPASLDFRAFLHSQIPGSTKKTPHCCAVCGSYFSRKFNLKVHLRTHTGERRTSLSSSVSIENMDNTLFLAFPCPVDGCKSRFVYRTHVWRHCRGVHGISNPDVQFFAKVPYD